MDRVYKRASTPRAASGRASSLGLAVLFVATFGCGGGGASDDGGSGDAATDAPMCGPDNACPGSLVCADGTCQRADCDLGTEGCACGAGERCARGADGMPLVCTGGVCSSATCPAGDPGCACIDGEECRDSASVCRGGFCVDGACEDGSRDCPCLAGTCDVGLFCLDGRLCVDDAGYEGGPCLDGGRCHTGQVCEAALDLCVACELGSAGCGCAAGGVCSDGLTCSAGLCLSAIDLPPADPTCFTPCTRDLETESGTRVCDSDGLLRGCVDHLVCTEGACLPPGAEKPSCESDRDCPTFQACLSGSCYSNCEGNVDCPAGMGCFHKVCRIPCESTAGAEVCPAGTFCDASDGVAGFCRVTALDPSPGVDTPEPGGGFEISVATLDFTNIRTELPFGLLAVNDTSGLAHRFTVRKLWHEIIEADGTSRRADAVRDPVTGELEPCDVSRPEACPMPWLEITPPGGAPSTALEVTFLGAGGCDPAEDCPFLVVGGAGDFGDGVRWTGGLEIVGNGGREPFTATYVERPDGQWAGAMHYFGFFPDGGFRREDPADPPGWLEGGDIRLVSNALIQLWDKFRRGRLDGWDEMQAILSATREESWGLPEVVSRCAAAGNPGSACYPWTNTAGVRVYADDPAVTPIPRGETQLPFVMNLRQPGDDAQTLVGRIDSGGSLHYPGSPAVTVSFSTNPTAPDSCDPTIYAASEDCVMFMEDFSATTVVGARYVSRDGSCLPGFEARSLPFLVDGFRPFRGYDSELDERERVFCLDAQLPFDTGAAGGDAREEARLEGLNWSLAGANPVPDGFARTRDLRMLDGAMINQSTLFILFEETFESFVADAGGDSSVKAYGYILLQRQPADLDPDDRDRSGIADVFEGNTPPAVSRTPVTSGASCDPQLVAAVGASTDAQLVRVLIDGRRGGTIPAAQVHYFCEDTGLFDGGRDDNGTSTGSAIPCPLGSRVVYFSTPTRSQLDIARLACQTVTPCAEDPADTPGCGRGTCIETLNQWRASGVIEQYDPTYTCVAGGAYCDDDRLDLRAGKTFHYPPPSGPPFNALQADIEAAFRYRTRFTSSSGSRVGFAPRICIPDSDQIPYCYDPPVIESVRDRMDCLIAIYSDRARFGALPQSDGTWGSQSGLQSFLKGNFSEFEPGRDGFERLYAELLVMQGDEALTQAFGSRFDLAGVSSAAFEGSRIEPDGINLSGVAGAQMFNLYKAVQLYQMALDRLYSLGPDMSVALLQDVSVDNERVFLSAETVVLYIDRLIRASTQKARAYREIAKNYQALNRPDLARLVIGRAYAGTHLEAAIIQQLMLSIASKASSPDIPQIEQTIVDSQRRYRMALLGMRELFASITDDYNIFGFQPDYVPFPLLDATAASGPDGLGPPKNAFEFLLFVAKRKADFARQREAEAISSNRSFQVGAATFQSELVRIRNTYENQLAELCGTFVSPADGRVYPAIPRYASRHPDALLFGDPCGNMGNGAIYQSIGALQDRLLSQQEIIAAIENLFERIEIERARASAMCGEFLELSDYRFQNDGREADLAQEVAEIRVLKERINNSIQGIIGGMGGSGGCSPPNGKFQANACPRVMGKTHGTGQTTARVLAGVAAGLRVLSTINSYGVPGAGIEGREQQMVDTQREIAGLQAESSRWFVETECEAALIDSNSRTATMLLGLKELELQMRRTELSSRLAGSEVQRLHERAMRVLAEQDETQSLLVDVEAARTDPNVRVYRNDAIINADIAFDDALQAAYRATKVFEYYTSQSYPRWEQLFLVRMVSSGDFNLDNYLIDLENAFFDFEDVYGAPDLRVLQLSMMDDMYQIPRLADDGTALSETQRIAMLRERLQDVDALDENGYLTIPFQTTLERVSPLTRNHKIEYVEVDLVANAGDQVARLYLRQAGTGIVRGLDDELDFFVFPERTAVINPFISGHRVFSPDVYRSLRFRDRPLVNTRWELVLNMRDELENRDIQLDTVTDVRVLVYYSDFTAL